MLLEDLQLRLGGREVSVEVEAALADGDALGVHGELAQGGQRVGVAFFLPRLGVVGVNTLRQGEKALYDFLSHIIIISLCIRALESHVIG